MRATTLLLLWTLAACGASQTSATETADPIEPAPTTVEEAPGGEGAPAEGPAEEATDARGAPAETAPPSPPALEPEELTGAVIQRVVRGRLAEFRDCYESRLVLSPRLAGRVTLELVVGADGAVVEASIHESTIDDAEVDECVVGVGRSLRFPPPVGGDDVVVRYPFAFGSG